MSMYAEFFKEIAGWETLETPEFFATYQLSDINGLKGLKIINAFIAKEFRNQGRAYDIISLMEAKAKAEHCKIFSALVAKDASEFIQQRTIHILRSKGMELMYEDDYNKIYGRSL